VIEGGHGVVRVELLRHRIAPVYRSWTTEKISNAAAVHPHSISALTRKYEDGQRKPDDLEAQEGQRPIAVHALENLGTSHTGINLLRHLLREQIKHVEDRLDPMNVMRDARANQKIPTNAWNTILSPAEASMFQVSEA
jgi:hypothetical protein